jgi:hypothetical protein
MRSGNRYAREDGSNRTLGQLVDSKMALVAICRHRKHQRVLYPPNSLCDDSPAIALHEHLRCRSCCCRMANLHKSSR